MIIIERPTDIRLLILSGNKMPKEIDQAYKCFNLIKLDISCNAIESLPAKGFENLIQLRILYLHQNKLKNIEPLYKLKAINYLTLFLNPISTQLSLRKQTLSMLKTLWALDFNIVTDEEKYRDLKLRPGKQNTRLPWPIMSFYHDTQMIDQNQLVNQVWQELNIIRKLYEKSKVILRDQGLDNQFRENYKFSIYIKPIKKVGKKSYKAMEMFSEQYQDQFKKVKQIVQRYRQSKGKAIKEMKAARMIMRILRAFKFKNDLIMSQIEYGTQYRLYFNKDQLPLFIKILSLVITKLSSNDYFKKGYENTLIQLNSISATQNLIRQEDFMKMNKLYAADMITYRLPSQQQLKFNTSFLNNQITFPSQLAKVSTCLQRKQLAVIRKWMTFQKYQDDSNKYPFVQKYQELMPLRKSYFPTFKFNPEEKQRFRTTWQAINKFHYKEYKQLLVIQLSQEAAREFVKNVKIINHKSDDVFVCYFEKQLIQSVAAIKIQRTYRAYKDVIQNGKNLITIIQELKKERSIRIIQRWIINLKWRHRNNFFKSIAHRLKYINQDILYIPLNHYLNLSNLNENRIKFIVMINFVWVSYRSRHMQNLKMDFELFNQIRSKPLIPVWLGNTQQTDYESLQQGDGYHLLNYKTQMSIITIQEKNYCQFKFPSLEEARYRLILLSLLTYTFKYQTYMTLFTELEILDQKIYVEKFIAKINKSEDKIFDKQLPNTSCYAIQLTDTYDELSKNQISLKFYQNQLSKIIIQQNQPSCVPLQAQCYFGLQTYESQTETLQMVVNRQNVQTSGTMRKQQYLTTVSTNIKTVVLPDRPTTNQTFINVRDVQDYELPYKPSRQIKQISSNISRQCYRNKSLNNKQNILNITYSGMERPSFDFLQKNKKSESYHYQSNPNDDLERQKRFIQEQQNSAKQSQIDRVKQFKQQKLHQCSEKQFEQGLINGHTMVSRQADRFQHKLQNKMVLQSAQNSVQQKQEQNVHIQEIVKMNIASRQQQQRQKKRIHNNWIVERRQKIQVESRGPMVYVHSVLPEELFPLRLQE
ncbi:hypothetical protein pb186bvf_010346 [Paramecium bursaria]